MPAPADMRHHRRRSPSSAFTTGNIISFSACGEHPRVNTFAFARLLLGHLARPDRPVTIGVTRAPATGSDHRSAVSPQRCAPRPASGFDQAVPAGFLPGQLRQRPAPLSLATTKPCRQMMDARQRRTGRRCSRCDSRLNLAERRRHVCGYHRAVCPANITRRLNHPRQRNNDLADRKVPAAGLYGPVDEAFCSCRRPGEAVLAALGSRAAVKKATASASRKLAPGRSRKRR